MNPNDTYFQALADTVIKNLKKRQIEAYYCKTAADAVALASSIIKPDSTVSFGGSMTLSESGMLDELNRRSDITLLDRSKSGSPEEIFHKTLRADYFLMSSNAISVTGELVNIDASGKRVSAMIYGPKHVIILAGMNKVTPSLEKAISRAKNTAGSANAIRLKCNTPCASTGICSDCLSSDCICSQTVITRRSSIANRIKVILIGEKLGY